MDYSKKAQEINKEQLMAMDIDEVLEIEKEKLSDAELSARASDAMIFYNNYFKKVLRILTYEQMKWISTQAVSPEQVFFGRGSINGLYLIEEWFKKQLSIEADKRQPKESFKEITEK